MKAVPDGPIEVLWSEKPEHIDIANASNGRVLMRIDIKSAVSIGHYLIEMGAEKGVFKQSTDLPPFKTKTPVPWGKPE